MIGLAHWDSKPYVGRVLIGDMSGDDPLHELLINTSDRELSVANPQEYHDRAKELLQSTEALSSSLTLLYSERIERKLAKLQKFMVGRRGQEDSEL